MGRDANGSRGARWKRLLIAVSGLKAKCAGRIIRTVLVVCMGARVHGLGSEAILCGVKEESRLK